MGHTHETGAMLSSEQRIEMAVWIVRNGHDSTEIWARASGYIETPCCGWVGLDDDPVNIEVAAYKDMLAQKKGDQERGYVTPKVDMKITSARLDK